MGQLFWLFKSFVKQVGTKDFKEIFHAQKFEVIQTLDLKKMYAKENFGKNVCVQIYGKKYKNKNIFGQRIRDQENLNKKVFHNILI